MHSIEVKNLTKKFGEFVSVDNLNFSVKKAEVFGFLGANGAGKSTTIKMMCGILNPTSGTAIIGGIDITDNPDAVKKIIGYMSQKFSLYNDLTVEENINFFSSVYGLDDKVLAERKKWALKISDLIGNENILTGQLPGGIKQRLALATAVIHNPKIVFLDEPTSGVDPIARREFWDLIFELSNLGTTVFVTTHYLEEAEYCENIILLDKGKIIAEGNPKELKTESIKNAILEIQTLDILGAMKELETAPFVKELSVFGNKLHLITNDNFSDILQVQNFLGEKFPVNKVEKISPKLEDVFIHLLSKEVVK